MEVMAVSALVLGTLMSGGLWFAWRAKARRGKDTVIDAATDEPVPSVEQEQVEDVAESGALEPPSRIVVTQGHEEVMSMAIMDEASFRMLSGRTSKIGTNVFSGALEPLMQVAPSMATAAMAGNRQLMEVVVSGQLVRAADGQGYRAIVMGADGIKEHARLFTPSNLQNVANASAIWQLASVAVAQKHLADISAALERVESKVDDIQTFLEEQRRAEIKSAMHYVNDARKAVASGEFLERTRDQLERLDVKLDEASLSLSWQIKRNAKAKLKRGSFGCEEEYKSALAKHRSLSMHVHELTLCNEVRAANLYLCGLYPQESKMLLARFSRISKMLTQADALRVNLEKAMDEDCAQIKSRFISNAKIERRRGGVKEASATEVFEESKSRCHQVVKQMGAMARDRKSSHRLIVESQDGKPSAVFLCHDEPVQTTS